MIKTYAAFLETSIAKETTSSLKPSLESQMYLSNHAAYAVATQSSVLTSTNVNQGEQV